MFRVALAILKSGYEAFAKGDVQTVLGLLDAGIEWNEAEHVLGEARYRATARATGKPLDAQVAHVWGFRDGKVIRFQQYADIWQFAQVTGITPKS